MPKRRAGEFGDQRHADIAREPHRHLVDRMLDGVAQRMRPLDLPSKFSGVQRPKAGALVDRSPARQARSRTACGRRCRDRRGIDDGLERMNRATLANRRPSQGQPPPPRRRPARAWRRRRLPVDESRDARDDVPLLHGAELERGFGFCEPAHTGTRGKARRARRPRGPRAIAIDPTGHRIGYGAGYYNRTVVRFAPPAVTIGVAFDFQLVAEVPFTEHDVPLAHVVTDEREMVAGAAGA